MTRWLARAMPYLTPAAVVLALIAVLPPVGSFARQDASVQALQFAIFAVPVPALLVLGISFWLGRTARRRSGPSMSASRWNRAVMPGLRLPASPVDRRADPDGRAAAAKVLLFAALVITWRLPAVLDALASYPAVTAAEMVTLAGAGSAVWIDLLAAAPLRRPLPRPLRAAIAAVAMWTIWIVAYITGMSGAASTQAGSAPHALTSATQLQLGVAVMWTVPAIFFAPVVYTMLIRWLGERDDPDAELRAASLSGSGLTGLNARPRPPRGWRSPPQ
jgi:cytochrome c oxidase assembly factor CtaG